MSEAHSLSDRVCGVCGRALDEYGTCPCVAHPAPCWLCDGIGRVEVERDYFGRPVMQACMACLGGKDARA